MATHPFEITVLSIDEVHTLPGAWPEAELRRLLAMAEADDLGQVDEAELLDMALMALQDLGHQKAGELVLEAVFGDAMRYGVRQNLVDDLQQDEPWSDFAVVAQQRGLFVAVVLLQKAFPSRYAVPDALRLRLEIRAPSEGGAALLDDLDAARLMRLLARGMSDTDVLNRLYEDALAAGPFEDAAGMIWHREAAAGESPRSLTVTVIGPRLWFEPLHRGQVVRASV